MVNAKALASHIDSSRSIYLPLIIEALQDPYEVWLNFDKHTLTGKVTLRSRVLKAFDVGDGKVLLVSAQANKGMLEAWTVIPVDKKKANYLDKQRTGRLVYGRKD